MNKKFSIEIDKQIFSVSSSVAPDDELAKYRASVSLDAKEIADSKSTVVLSVHWKFRDGLLNKVAGILELQAIIRNSGAHNVASEGALKEEIQRYMAYELSDISNAGPLSIDTVDINQRRWLKYAVPKLAMTEYSTALSDNRYLTVQFALVDDADQPEWKGKARALIEELVKSLNIDLASNSRA
ncbi:MAG: hypothetical protein V4731_11860 [Pseudomonadota bacterium]